MPLKPWSLYCICTVDTLGFTGEKIENYVLHDAVCSLYQCSLSFQNFIWFHSTHMNVISLTPTWKVWPSTCCSMAFNVLKCGLQRAEVWHSACWASQTQNHLPNCCGHLLYWIVSKLDGKCRKYRQNLIYVPKYCIAFTAPIFMKLMITLWHYIEIFIPNFTQNGQEIWSVGVKIHLGP